MALSDALACFLDDCPRWADELSVEPCGGGAVELSATPDALAAFAAWCVRHGRGDPWTEETFVEDLRRWEMAQPPAPAEE